MKRADVRLYVALAVAGAAALYVLKRSLPSLSDLVPSADTTRAAVANVGGYAGQAAAGAVEGVGLAIGIPRTDQTQCERDKAAGNWWAASFSCPAGDFLSSGASAVFGSTAVNQATQADVRRVDNSISLLPGQGVTDSSGNYVPWGALPL